MEFTSTAYLVRCEGRTLAAAAGGKRAELVQCAHLAGDRVELVCVYDAGESPPSWTQKQELGAMLWRCARRDA